MRLSRRFLSPSRSIAPLFALFALSSLHATVYEVGPGKAYASIGAVPWEALQAGDSVLIYWRSTPYQEKWVICRQGTPAAPIVVRGVPGPNGELPVIDGNGATTRTALNYWNEVRGLLKIGGANVPADTMPSYITIENLDFRSARPPYTYIGANGTTQSYVADAAAIYVERAQHLIIRNCVLHDSGNGLFVSAGDAPWTQDVLIDGNSIYDNGNVGSLYEHNNYSEALGITFQYNHFGPPKTGASGNNLKDRSAGLVVRYNWIEGGNRQLDFVDSDYFSAEPAYRTTFVYGNLLIEPAGAGNNQITHYGGDSGTTGQYRKGMLYFYNNTVVSTRTDHTTLFRLSSNDEQADARNNLFYVSAAGTTLALLDQTGTLNLTHNWFKPGYASTFGTLDGVINDDGTSVKQASPGFANVSGQDFHLTAGATPIDAGAVLASAVLPANNVVYQYVKHQASEARPVVGALDIGAYEFTNAASRCDFNGDGEINALDWQRLINVSLGVTPPNGEDLNRDGHINVQDVQILSNVIAGSGVCPP